MSPIERDLRKWLRPIVASKEFPVLCLQIKKRINGENIHSASDTENMFGKKTGARESTDRVFELMIDLSEASNSNTNEQEDFSEDFNAKLS